uniref:Uncharacterized protein n=1 Tax=Anguilla anguilla TaxID=7936 RepID=A0A0E9QBC4_ANGAN
MKIVFIERSSKLSSLQMCF